MAGPMLKDAKWSRQSFITHTKDMEDIEQRNRIWSSANTRFTDTTPGGAFVVNPPPQFTRYADLKADSPYFGSKKEGRYYVEAIAENYQVINIRLGVPEFNSLTSFFGGFYNSAAGQLARTGRATGLFYSLGNAAGMIVGVIFWPLLAAAWIGQAAKWAMGKPSSKFCFLKPDMPNYWSAVQAMVNHIAVNAGIVPRIGGADDPGGRIGGPYDFSKDMLKLLHEKMPEIFNSDGQLDVLAFSTRAQRLATKRYKKMKAIAEDLQSADIGKVVQGIVDDKSMRDNGASFTAYRDRWLKAANSKPKSADDSDASSEKMDKSEAANAGFGDFLEAELNDGAAFISFRVNATGPASESFSSSVGESQIAQKLNGVSASARDTNFSFANGNIDSGLIGQMVGGVLSAAKDFATGIGNGLGVSGLAMLAGAAFVDIPQHWQNSTASLPKMSYTIHLGTPYNNPISRLIHVYTPLAMLLAMSLPKSTGRQSYTSPFLLELYDQGHAQTRYGIVNSISISRGEGNLGFNNEGQFMAVEVNLEILDLSSVMHMPISEGFNMNAMRTGVNVGTVVGGVAGGVGGAAAGATVGGAVGAGVDAAAAVGKTISSFFDDETVYSDYLAVLGNMGVADQIYTFRRLKLQLTRSTANLKSFFSAAHYASYVGDTIPARMLSAIYRGTER